MNRRKALIKYRAKLVKAHEFARQGNYVLLHTYLAKAGLVRGKDCEVDESHPDYEKCLNKWRGSAKLWLDSIAYADKLIKGCK